MNSKSWMPRTDIKETDSSIILYAEMPGLTLDDVHVEVNNGILTMRGEKKFEKKEDKKHYHRLERRFGAFSRSFRLPEGAEDNDVCANLKHGVLEVVIKKPMMQIQGGKKIQISDK